MRRLIQTILIWTTKTSAVLFVSGMELARALLKSQCRPDRKTPEFGPGLTFLVRNRSKTTQKLEIGVALVGKPEARS